MARKRMIDPSFWEDEKLGTLEPTARLLFMGLISQADDDGRLKGHPSLLRSVIFPYDVTLTNEQVDEWLNLLADSKRKLIVRYEVDNQKYIWIRNFKKHQTINKPQKSKLPEYSGSTTVVVTEHDGSPTAQEKLREEKLKEVEEEVKGKEMPSPDSDIRKDRILELMNEFITIENYNRHDLDNIESYLDVVEEEVIEAAIKKGSGKTGSYVHGTIKGFLRDGVTKADQVRGFQVLKGGVADAKYQGNEQGTRFGRNSSKSESLSITDDELDGLIANR